MADSFSGAEGAVDAQKKSALDALAQFGRRGLEAAVVAQNEGNRIQNDAASANASFGDKLNVGDAGQAALAAQGQPARDAYALNGAQSVAFLRSENDAAQQVNSNFYGQLRQSVPLARTESAQAVDEYRAAYEERQAQAAANARAQEAALANAALEQQMMREQMARDEELYGMQMSPWRQAIAEALRKQAAQAEILKRRRSGMDDLYVNKGLL